jgi:hypothetical protein
MYFNPPTAVKDVGRELPAHLSFAELTRELQPHEVLFGLWLRRFQMFWNAPQLHREAEWAEFRRQERDGLLAFYGYYAVPIEAARKGCGSALNPQEVVSGD